MHILKVTHPDTPPPMATDAKGCYREALVETWGKVPERRGVGRPPTRKQPQPGWHYLQVQKIRSGSRLVEVRVEVIYGEFPGMDHIEVFAWDVCGPWTMTFLARHLRPHR